MFLICKNYTLYNVNIYVKRFSQNKVNHDYETIIAIICCEVFKDETNHTKILLRIIRLSTIVNYYMEICPFYSRGPRRPRRFS